MTTFEDYPDVYEKLEALHVELANLHRWPHGANGDTEGLFVGLHFAVDRVLGVYH